MKTSEATPGRQMSLTGPVLGGRLSARGAALQDPFLAAATHVVWTSRAPQAA